MKFNREDKEKMGKRIPAVCLDRNDLGEPYCNRFRELKADSPHRRLNCIAVFENRLGRRDG
jgi:hypothetical protein